MKRTMKLSLALFFLGSACYLTLLLGFRLQIFHYLYADKYAAYTGWPLVIVGLLPFVQILPEVMGGGGGLGALERPNLGFWSGVGGGAIALTLGVPLASRLGVVGALVGIAISYFVTGVLALLFVRRCLRREGAQHESASPHA